VYGKYNVKIRKTRTDHHDLWLRDVEVQCNEVNKSERDSYKHCSIIGLFIFYKTCMYGSYLRIS
jgi:hypothetical protein